MVKKFLRVSFLLTLLTTATLAKDNSRLLLYGNCITCHNETKDISAPSLQYIKEKYHSAFPEKIDFVAYMSTWVLKPNSKTSIMQDKINQYGLMPELGYDKDTLEKIAAYIYDNKVE